MHILLDFRPLQDPLFFTQSQFFSLNFFIALFRNYPDFSFFVWTNDSQNQELPFSFEEFENVHRLHTNESSGIIQFLSENFSYPLLDDLLETEAMKRGKMPWSARFDAVFFMLPFLMPVEENCIKIAFAEHSSHFFYPSLFFSEHQKFQKKKRYFREIQESDLVLVPSAFDKAEYSTISKKIDAEKIVVLPVGVEEKWGKEIWEDEKTAFLEEKNLHKPFFIVPLEDITVDNFAILQQAYALFYARFGEKSWGMVCFSENPAFPDLSDEIFENLHEGIRLMSICESEKKLLFANAQFFVAPWAMGSKPQIMLQAMRFSLPIASSNFCGLPEYAEEAAIYFDPTSSVSIFRAFKKFFSEEQTLKMFSEKSEIQGEKEKFSFDEIAKSVIKLVLKQQEKREMETEA